MAKQYPDLNDKHRAFIEKQKIFFTATAAGEGRINLSPRNATDFKILSPNSGIYLDLIGSGNETAALLKKDGRMTIMFCAFEGSPMILRLYGNGRIIQRGNAEFASILSEMFGNVAPRSLRQFVHLDFDLVQSSCGFGVPFFDFVEDRSTMNKWVEAKSDEELVQYQNDKNVTSMDGFPTGLFD